MRDILALIKDIEATCKPVNDALLAIDGTALTKQLNEQVKILSTSNRDGSDSFFFNLSEDKQKIFAICNLAWNIHHTTSRAVFDINPTTTSEVEAYEKRLHKHNELLTSVEELYGLKDPSGFLAAMRSEALLFMSAVTSLGRANLSRRITQAPISFEALLLRIKCESLYPEAMQKFYDQCLPGEKLLTAKQQRQEARAVIYLYLCQNDFSNLPSITAAYKNLVYLLGPRSVLSLFTHGENATEDAENALIHEGMLTLIKKHPILSHFAKSSHLAALESTTQAWKTVEIAAVLFQYPYSITLEHANNPSADTTELGIVDTTVENADPIIAIATKAETITAAPMTQRIIANIDCESYRHYEARLDSTKTILALLHSAIPKGERTSITNFCLDQHTSQTLARVFDMCFSPAIERTHVHQECTRALLQAVVSFQDMFSEQINISDSGGVNAYLERLKGIQSLEPQLVLSLLIDPLWHNNHSTSQKKTACTIADFITEDADLITYNTLVLTTFILAVKDIEHEFIDTRYYKPIIQKCLMALDATTESLNLLKLFRDDLKLKAFCSTPTGSPTLASISGKTTTTLTSKINVKIASIETQQQGTPSGSNATPYAALSSPWIALMVIKSDAQSVLEKNFWSNLSKFTK